jgi:hypothetical protein
MGKQGDVTSASVRGSADSRLYESGILSLNSSRPFQETGVLMVSGEEDRSSSGGRTEPISILLKRQDVGLSAAKANRMLLAEGILEEKTRPSEKEPGKLRTYKALTDAGLRYGVNKQQQLVNETTPRYYEDTFAELVSKYLIAS